MATVFVYSGPVPDNVTPPGPNPNKILDALSYDWSVVRLVTVQIEGNPTQITSIQVTVDLLADGSLE